MRLIQLKIEHIAGVDKPANRRKFLVVKSESDILKQMTIKKEGDKYCVYDGDKKVGEYATIEEARAAMKKTEKKEGAAMLTKEQLAKLMGLLKSDEDLSKAVVDQQEEVVNLGKKITELEAAMKSGSTEGGDVFKNEKLWEGVSPVLRNRMEEIIKERDKAAEDAKVEKEQREEQHWVGKAKTLKYAQVSEVAFGKIMRKIASNAPDEAEEVFRIMEKQDDLIGKGALFQTIGQNTGIQLSSGDATNATARVEAMARDFRTIEPKLTYEESVNKVFKERPDLYKAYNRESRGSVNNSERD